MKITKITQQAKLQSRYSIYVDGQYSFSLSESGLLDSKLIQGQTLSPAELKSWKQRSAEDKISGNALRYAAMRLRSIWEMEQYLRRKKVSPALAEIILNKLINLKLLNDLSFAQAWIANRRLLRPTSKRKLQQELRAKHVSDEVITQAINDDETSELDVLRQMVNKKRNLSKYKADNMKLMQYLARQGFDYGDIKSVLEE